MSIEAIEFVFRHGLVVPPTEESEEEVYRALLAAAVESREARAAVDPEFVAAHPIDERIGRQVARRICALREVRP